MLSIISFGQRLGMEGGTVSVSECLSPPLLFFRAKLSFITLKSQGQGPTVPKWVPFGSPRGPFCEFGSPLGLLFCPEVPCFSILG